MAMSMGSSTAAASSIISAAPAAIRPLSRLARSCRLVLAIGIPLLVLLLAVLALEQWRDQLPPSLQRLAGRPSWL
jgi:hypothetical protein